MLKEYKVYKCEICQNMVVLIQNGGGELVCCGQPMNEIIAGEDDTAALEKHVPVIKKEGDILKVAVGDVPHPMTEQHYIQWIAVVTKKGAMIEHLTWTDKPEASFNLPENTTSYEVYEYCNLHGLWKA